MPEGTIIFLAICRHAVLKEREEDSPKVKATSKEEDPRQKESPVEEEVGGRAEETRCIHHVQDAAAVGACRLHFQQGDLMRGPDAGLRPEEKAHVVFVRTV